MELVQFWQPMGQSLHCFTETMFYDGLIITDGTKVLMGQVFKQVDLYWNKVELHCMHDEELLGQYRQPAVQGSQKELVNMTLFLVVVVALYL